MKNGLGKITEVASRQARRLRFQLAETLSGWPEPKRAIEGYAAATTAWLLRAQAATPDDGVAESYHVLTRRWGASYPETTGYIICSILRAARSGRQDQQGRRAAALRMGHWLLGTQLECGAFPGGTIAIENRVPTVFNTGQILKGLTDLVSEGLDSDGRLARGAKRAADWLRQTQDEDGAWYQGRSPLTEGSVHSYDVRTAWAWSRYGEKLGDPGALQAAIRNAEWLCSRRERDGWFAHMAFRPEESPLTHTVAYTIQGLLEIGVLAKRNDFLAAATQAATNMRALQNPKTGALPGQIAPGYRSAAEWSSATGNAQMAIIWFRLAQITGDSSWRESALKANRFNCSLQELDLNSLDAGRRGALRGSYPGHIGYGKFWYMNWTQKFHLDALLAQMGVTIV